MSGNFPNFRLKLLFIYWTAVRRCCGFSCTRASVKALSHAKVTHGFSAFPFFTLCFNWKWVGHLNLSLFESVYWTCIWMKTCALLMAERAHFHWTDEHSFFNRSWECFLSQMPVILKCERASPSCALVLDTDRTHCPPCSYPHFSFFFLSVPSSLMYFYCLYHIASPQAVWMCRICYIMPLFAYCLGALRNRQNWGPFSLSVRIPARHAPRPYTRCFFCSCCKVSKKKDQRHHVITCVLWD